MVLTYIIIAGLLFCVIMLIEGWRGSYGDDDDVLRVSLMALGCSLLWPATAICLAFCVAGKSLLGAGDALRRLWEERGRGPW